jgi:hypothetical protein
MKGTRREEGGYEPMPCDEWSRILRKYRSAVRIYSDAADALVAVNIGVLENWGRSEKARKACGRFRADLMEHEHKHGCLISVSLQEIQSKAPLTLQTLKSMSMVAVESPNHIINSLSEDI